MFQWTSLICIGQLPARLLLLKAKTYVASCCGKIPIEPSFIVINFLGYILLSFFNIVKYKLLK